MSSTDEITNVSTICDPRKKYFGEYTNSLYFGLFVVSICMSLSHFVMGVMKQSTCFIYCVFFPCKCRANMRFDLHVRVNMTKVKQT